MPEQTSLPSSEVSEGALTEPRMSQRFPSVSILRTGCQETEMDTVLMIQE